MIPAFTHDRAALFHGRAEDLGKMLAPKSIGALITDPPYSEHTHANLGREQRDDGGKERDALEFPALANEQIQFYAAEWVRLVNGWIIVFCDDRSLSAWGTAIERGGGRWVRTGYYVKTNPMPQMSGDRPSTGAEPILIAHSYPYGKGRMVWNGGGRAATWRGARDKPSITCHPNQKPRWLMQELAGLFAAPGALVVDPFMGGGSTGVGALASERFEGSETRPKPKKRPRGVAPADEHFNVEHRRDGAAPELETAPMPERLDFIGIEGDAKHVQTAITRIGEVLA